jgi:ectoine hydroxylase-related dioxygenase (phytanoyl-CoA dioxygenase family)
VTRLACQLSAVGLSHGSLAVVPGSHLTWPDSSPPARLNCQLPVDFYKLPEHNITTWHATEYQPGDVLLFHVK